VSKHGKNYLKARSLKEDEKEYTIEEAVSLLKRLLMPSLTNR